MPLLTANGVNGDAQVKPENISQLALETTLLINASNPTTVGLWDLEKPSAAETSKRIRLNRLETLGPEGDRRTRANDSNITPTGQYKAICKLFMAYVNGGKDEYIGTGWLIGNDMIVTAGHCVYDWKDKGGFLKYIKVYFGYNSSSSPGMYRYGISVSCPAEYLKAESDQHDLSFIRLNSPVEGIPLVTYSNTPALDKAQLGVVGYPGDLDFGEYMYEHWATVDIDLANTGTLLSYKIDTMPGQSGAPVLRKLANGRVDAIGVHIAGGFPNTGSVIGPIGNRFEEYLLAMKVKGGYKSSSATILSSASSPPIQGFQIISIKPTPSSLGGASGISAGSESEKAPNKQMESALRELFGNDPNPAPIDPEKPRGGVASGTLTQFPETLKLTPRLETDPKPPPVDYDRAVANAKAQEDVQTIFFIDFPAQLEGESLTAQRALMSSVQSWQAWSSTTCEGKVQQQVDAGKLPSDSKGQFARSAYRAKVFDYLFRQSSWFAKTFDQNMSRHMEVKKAEFHSEILTTVLEGYSVPSSVFSNLEKVLKQISDGIKLSSETSSDSQQYWIMLTKYNWQPISQTVQTMVRVIQFQVDQQARHYSSNKASYDSVSFDLNFNQYQADFNNEIYAKIRTSMDEKLVKQGMDLVAKNMTEVNIPV